MNAVTLITLLVACDSATKRLDHGRALVTERKYDEAIKVYVTIKADYPETPEAKQVSEAIDDAKVAVADDLFADGKYVEAGQAFAAFMGDDDGRKTAPGWSADAEVQRMVGAIARSRHQQDLARALQWATISAMPRPLDDQSMNTLFVVWDNAGKTDSPGADAAEFKAAAATWFCEHRDDFASLARCKGYTAPGEGPTLERAAKTSTDATEALKACGRVHTLGEGVPAGTPGNLGEICGADVLAEYESQVVKANGTLEMLAYRTVDVYRDALRKDWAVQLNGMRDLAANCEKVKRETANVIQQGLRTDRESAEFYWRGVATGTIKTDAEIPRMVRSFQTQFATYTLAHQNALKSEFWSDECNKAIEEGFDRIFEECAQDGSPKNVAWISSFMPHDCPIPWTPPGE